MSNLVSVGTMQALMAQQTDRVLLECLTIEHATLTTPVRLVRDRVNLVRAAGTFLAFPFEITFPDQRDDQLPSVELRLDNVDRTISAAIEALTSEPTVTVEVVPLDDPNTVEAGPFVLTLRNINYDASSIRGQLAFEDVLNEPFPEGTFTPKDFPGIFQ